MSTVKVLLLGSFHMANPGADIVNLDADDVLHARRQEEIESVVEALSRFEPSKVIVEHPQDDESLFDRYVSFRLGRSDLGRSEPEQLGFRLAALCAHDRVWPADVVDRFYEERIEQLLERPEHATRWAALRDAGQASVDEVAAALRAGTIADALRVVNQREAKTAAIAPYLDALLPIGEAGNWAGADMVANWYRRNFRIAANVHAIAEDGDRLVIIYGAGHVPVLEHALSMSTQFGLVDPLEYLPGA